MQQTREGQGGKNVEGSAKQCWVTLGMEEAGPNYWRHALRDKQDVKSVCGRYQALLHASSGGAAGSRTQHSTMLEDTCNARLDGLAAATCLKAAP